MVEPIVSDLEYQLYRARHDLIDLAAKSVPDGWKLFFGYLGCKSKDQYHQWERDMMVKIIAAAIPDQEPRHYGMRACCPLCKEGTESWSAGHQGFTIPEGLERHLKGSYRAHECPVMAAISALADKHVKPMLEEEDQREIEAEKTRRKTERLYRIDASAPKLIDERIWDPDRRSKEQFKWAEDRLRALHFEVALDDNVISYQLHHGDFTILADLRHCNKIQFQAFRRSPTGKLQYLTRKGKQFSLPDAWTNDIPFKFRKWLDDACAPRKTPVRQSTRKLWNGKKRVLTPRTQPSAD